MFWLSALHVSVAHRYTTKAIICKQERFLFVEARDDRRGGDVNHSHGTSMYTFVAPRVQHALESAGTHVNTDLSTMVVKPLSFVDDHEHGQKKVDEGVITSTSRLSLAQLCLAQYRLIYGCGWIQTRLGLYLASRAMPNITQCALEWQQMKCG